MIFQEPMTALNPVFTVGDQIAEVARVHASASRRAAWDRAVEMLTMVGIPAPAERASQYPHQLSGGMRQRVLIAMALVMNPALVLADEPTTALDVTIQAQILELLADLQQRLGTSIAMITHDLGVIAEVASRVVVMYGGEVVRRHASRPCSRTRITRTPKASSTRCRASDVGRNALAVIPGSVPPPTAWPTGCRFRDRCAYAWDRCAREHPPLYQIGAGHVSRCHLADEPERRRTARVTSQPSTVAQTAVRGGGA
jgi:oligopeptide/dipeptide ABC transporter ATP-binding protein